MKKTTYILCLLFFISLVLIQPTPGLADHPDVPSEETLQQDVGEPNNDIEQQEESVVQEPVKVLGVPPQVPQPEKVPEQPEKSVATEPEKPLFVPPKVPQPQKAPATVSFFFDDADIFEVIQTVFADILKVNYIIDPQVKGRVNFRTITPIPKDEVLSVIEIIFRLNGIGFVEEKGLYRILPLTQVSRELIYSQIGKGPETVAIEMFTFKNLVIRESMPEIENALGLQLQGGTVRIVPVDRLNSLIVVASSEAQMSYIRKWVEAFDDMFAIARPKIFVYPLQNSKAEHIASLLQSIFSGTASTSTSRTTTTTTPGVPPTAPPAPTAPRTGVAASAAGGGGFVAESTRIFADEITNSLIILATPADYSFIEETIEKLDIVPRQVVIEALVAEVRLTDDLSFGLAWSLKTDIKITDIDPFSNNIFLNGEMGQRSSSLGEAGLSGSGFSFYATDDKGIVRARIEALANDSRAKVLASPHILVLDNREARIQIGDQVPIATSETNVPGTTQIQRTIQYKDTGVILKVKPQVNEGGLVTLDLTQEVSTYSIQKIFDSDQVVISKREATTNLVAQNGQTIIIGGLIQEIGSKAREGIPLLSKIPVLGSLFGATTDKYEQRELIILLTPHVLQDQREAADITHGYLNRLQGVQKAITKKDSLKIEDMVKDKERKQTEQNQDNPEQ